jgi:hypothetical protein
MLRKSLLVAVISIALVILTAGAALAWDLIADKSGNGNTTLRAWTRNYNQVAFVADHAGTRVDVSLVVNCRNGDHFDNTWDDGGGRFRFILRGLGGSGRCNHTFRVFPASSFPDLYLAVLARG